VFHSLGFSTYHALRSRPTAIFAGPQFYSNYTFSKSIDNVRSRLATLGANSDGPSTTTSVTRQSFPMRPHTRVQDCRPVRPAFAEASLVRMPARSIRFGRLTLHYIGNYEAACSGITGSIPHSNLRRVSLNGIQTGKPLNVVGFQSYRYDQHQSVESAQQVFDTWSLLIRSRSAVIARQTSYRLSQLRAPGNCTTTFPSEELPSIESCALFRRNF